VIRWLPNPAGTRNHRPDSRFSNPQVALMACCDDKAAFGARLFG